MVSTRPENKQKRKGRKDRQVHRKQTRKNELKLLQFITQVLLRLIELQETCIAQSAEVTDEQVDVGWTSENEAEYQQLLNELGIP